MRRGHSGISWRNDNPRHFRPRGGGTPHYRHPRGYGHVDAPRFQISGPRPQRGPAMYSQHMSANDHMPPEHHERQGFRNNRGILPRPGRGQYPHQGQRNIFPLLHRMRQGDVPDHNSHQNTPNYYDNNPQPWETRNSMGDIDHRQPIANTPINPWANNPFNYEDRSPTKAFRHHDSSELIKMPQTDYAGHRPPASDHYGGSHCSTMDNSNTFSRSVDDTVNIVRKRLLSRESQPPIESPPLQQNEAEIPNEPAGSAYENTQSDQPTKKKSSKLRNMKSNCDKIKNKIVHQLFMMDKDKIHKLMDNPNSSSKFEYAISSLVTESQNSFNRHLRSVAEKSLCSSTSSEFIHDDNNTIYEDTFMKQMQCILDPQDTVLLEDIKPIVLAELSKVLQLDDLQYIQEAEEPPYSRDDLNLHEQYSQDSYENCGFEPEPEPAPVTGFEPYSPEQSVNYYDQKARSITPDYGIGSNTDFTNDNHDEPPLFERRKDRRSRDRRHSRSSEERRRKNSRSMKRFEDQMTRRGGTPKPLFDSHVEQLSDDEDPFAELDRQYHVAVDHNFIENEYMCSPQPSNRSRAHTPEPKKEVICHVQKPEKPQNKTPLFVRTPEKPLHEIKKEIESQLLDIAKSPLQFLSPPSIRSDAETPDVKTETDVKPELIDNDANKMQTPKQHRKSKEDTESSVNVPLKQEPSPDPKTFDTTPNKSESSNSVKSSTPTDSRKRSIDQKPSHRKEKRKKSDSSQQDTTNKQILNKNIIIHVSDCAAKTSEKSIFNLYFSKENSGKESSKDIKKVDSNDKKHSERNVKKKEKDSSTVKKTKEKDTGSKKKYDTNSSGHSILSPTDVSNANSSQTATKGDGQTKLKPIDIFSDLPKRTNIVHLAHRNTAVSATPTKTTPVELKPVVLGRKITKRHVSTQVIRKSLTKEVQTTESKSSSSRFCQTERKRLMTRGAQTEPVSFKSTSKSTDPLERMKEIDMEIQALLQEKFKLYNSLETKEPGTSTMQSLGMAVLNVSSVDSHEGESSISEDTIVDDFANIPVEELEQIAMESVQEESLQCDKRNRKQKIKGQNKKKKKLQSKNVIQSIPSTTTITSRNKRAAKTPNISLIEQIITDNRPLEDIISLDELESPPKKRSHKAKTKVNKKSIKKKRDHPVVNYDVKPCSVVLKRVDLNKIRQKLQNLLKSKVLPKPIPESKDSSVPEPEPSYIADKAEIDEPDIETVEMKPEANESSSAQTVMVVEAVINDIQFDMLDVSEDIVIGDVCEVKFDEKGAGERPASSISEEIILDNSQSSADEAAATEGDGECKIYDYSTDEDLRRDSVTVSGNGDAVLAVECIENNFIAACLDGSVYYFSGEGKLLKTLRGSNLAVTCLTIVQEKYGTTVYTGSLDSRIRYYDLETGMEKGPECNVLSPIQTMDRAWDTVFVGTRTGFVLQFECKNNMLIPVSTVKFSDQSILALRALKEGPRKVLLVGARSEAVTVKDAQTGLLLRTLEGPKMSVYSLLFEDGKVYCGTSSHLIHVFDYASGSHIGAHSGGKGVVCLRATGGLVFAGCYDGCVYIYREGDSAPLAQMRGPSHMLLSLAVLGTKIIAGYKDRSLYIWKIPLPVLKEMIL